MHKRAFTQSRQADKRTNRHTVTGTDSDKAYNMWSFENARALTCMLEGRPCIQDEREKERARASESARDSDRDKATDEEISAENK